MLSEALGGALAVTVIGSGVVITKYKLETLELKKEVAEGKVLIERLVNEKSNLNAALDKQNKAIDKMKIDYKSKIDEFMKRKPKMIEKIKIKYIKDINTTRGNCDDAKELNHYLDNITL